MESRYKTFLLHLKKFAMSLDVDNAKKVFKLRDLLVRVARAYGVRISNVKLDESLNKITAVARDGLVLEVEYADGGYTFTFKLDGLTMKLVRREENIQKFPEIEVCSQAKCIRHVKLNKGF